MASLLDCQECGQQIRRAVRLCPGCGNRTEHHESVTAAKVAIALFLVAALLYGGVAYLALWTGGGQVPFQVRCFLEPGHIDCP